MCRHHLTYQAKADLLQLLQVRLPKLSYGKRCAYAVTIGPLANMGTSVSNINAEWTRGS